MENSPAIDNYCFPLCKPLYPLLASGNIDSNHIRQLRLDVLRPESADLREAIGIRITCEWQGSSQVG